MPRTAPAPRSPQPPPFAGPAGLDAEQLAAVTAPPGPLLVVAGAGTGKTRTLVERVAHQVAAGAWDASRVLAVTHSTRAAGELRDRLARVSPAGRLVSARTFHSAALAVLRAGWEETGRPGPGPVIIESMYGQVRAAARAVRGLPRDLTAAQVVDLAGEVGWARSGLVPAAGYAAAAARAGRSVDGVTPAQVASLIQAYAERLEAAGVLDFTDVLTVATALLGVGGPTAARTRSGWRHVLVDEYQDTDPAQQAFLDELLDGGQDITVVGDPRQSIYAFKGSDASILASFAARHPGARVVSLVRDYRSTPQVVEVANRLAGPDLEPLVGMRPDGPAVRAVGLGSESDEAAWVASQVARRIAGGVPASEVAVLYRFNAQAAALEAAFAAAGVPVVVADSERFFDRPEVAGVVAAAGRMLAAWEAAELEGAGGDPGDRGDREAAAARVAGRVSGRDLLAHALAGAGFHPARPPEGAGAVRGEWEARMALLELVEAGPDGGRVAPRELLADLAERRESGHGAPVGAVTLSTLHRAKGLEWDVVVLPRWVEGSLPSAYATTAEAVAEEARLAYVGVTRARRELLVSWASRRDNAWRSKPSRFLAVAGLADGPEPAPARRSSRGAASSSGSAAGGARRARCPVCDGDEGLPRSGVCGAHLDAAERARFEALRAWRLERSRAESVPAFTILTDEQCRALAVLCPTSVPQLAASARVGAVKAGRWGQEVVDLLSR